ncbi:MAG: AmmeMemoRadiSam system protein A [Firmicutes bacterium]|nr:AmmeMemoRadiSam system protein A [Bacillota bacterium]
MVTLFGALDGLRVTPYVHSYEGPFGVGYCVATYVAVGRGESRFPGAFGTQADRSARTAPGGPGPVSTQAGGTPARAEVPVSGGGPTTTPTPTGGASAEGLVRDESPWAGPAPEPPAEPVVGTEAQAGAPPGGPWSDTREDEAGTGSAQDEGGTGAGFPEGEGEPGAGSPWGGGETGTGLSQDEGGTGAGFPQGEEGTGVSPAEDEAEDDELQPQRQHPFVRLARLSLETFVRERRQIQPPPGCPGLDRRAGAFVSLKKHGELRGCIGTIEATTPSLAEEIIRNAIQAGTADPRFYPVTEEELDDLVYSVDVLEPPEPVFGPADLDPKVYGVIVTKGRRTGLLLPDLEGIETAEQQLAIARQKAGLAPDDPDVRVYRFRVTRYR